MEMTFRHRLPDLQAGSLPDKAPWQVCPSAAYLPQNAQHGSKWGMHLFDHSFGLHVSCPRELGMQILSSFWYEAFVWQLAYKLMSS